MKKKNRELFFFIQSWIYCHAFIQTFSLSFYAVCTYNDNAIECSVELHTMAFQVASIADKKFRKMHA